MSYEVLKDRYENRQGEILDGLPEMGQDGFWHTILKDKNFEYCYNLAFMVFKDHQADEVIGLYSVENINLIMSMYKIWTIWPGKKTKGYNETDWTILDWQVKHNGSVFCGGLTKEEAQRLVDCMLACEGIQNPAVLPEVIKLIEPLISPYGCFMKDVRFMREALQKLNS